MVITVTKTEMLHTFGFACVELMDGVTETDSRMGEDDAMVKSKGEGRDQVSTLTVWWGI